MTYPGGPNPSDDPYRTYPPQVPHQATSYQQTPPQYLPPPQQQIPPQYLPPQQQMPPQYMPQQSQYMPQQMPPGMPQFMQNFATTPDLQLRTLQDQRKTLVRAVFAFKYYLPAVGILAAAYFLVIGFKNDMGSSMITTALIFVAMPLIARFTAVKTIQLNLERIDHQIELTKRQIAAGA